MLVLRTISDIDSQVQGSLRCMFETQHARRTNPPSCRHWADIECTIFVLCGDEDYRSAPVEDCWLDLGVRHFGCCGRDGLLLIDARQQKV